MAGLVQAGGLELQAWMKMVGSDMVLEDIKGQYKLMEIGNLENNSRTKCGLA